MKDFVRDVLDRAFNHGDLEALEQHFSPEAVIHDPGADLRGTAALRRGLLALRTSFPDFHFRIEDMLADGDRVALRYQASGTHSAEFLGIPTTGKRIAYTGMVIVRVEEGRIAEFWAQPDQLGILKQLGGMS
jgi:steroid delta-isomerase-like uncharacterized protein